MALWNYLKAVVSDREARASLSMEATLSVPGYLLKSFQLDPKFLDYASVDGDIEKTDYEEAKKLYDEWKGVKEDNE